MRFYDSLEQYAKENPDVVYRVWPLNELEEECIKYKIYGIIKIDNDYILQFIDPWEFDENNKYVTWCRLSNIHIEITDYDLEDHED